MRACRKTRHTRAAAVGLYANSGALLHEKLHSVDNCRLDSKISSDGDEVAHEAAAPSLQAEVRGDPDTYAHAVSPKGRRPERQGSSSSFAAQERARPLCGALRCSDNKQCPAGSPIGVRVVGERRRDGAEFG